MNTDNMKRPNEIHKAFVGFLYPAVLGSIIYSIYDSLPTLGAGIPPVNMFLGILLVGYFFLDFKWTANMDDPSKYNWHQAASDFLVTIIAFSAVNIAIQNGSLDRFPLSYIPALLAAQKILALYWERKRTDEINKIAQFIYLVFVGLFCAVFYFWSPFYLITLVSVDIFISVKWVAVERYCGRWRKQEGTG